MQAGTLAGLAMTAMTINNRNPFLNSSILLLMVTWLLMTPAESFQSHASITSPDLLTLFSDTRLHRGTKWLEMST